MNKSKKINIGKVIALRSIRDKVIELSKIMKELEEPVLYDLTLLPKLFQAYTRVFARRGKADRVLTVCNRKKFMLVILYLYSPKALVGESMRKGLRKEIARLFGLNTLTPISDNCSGLMIEYNAYPDFRRDVDLILEEFFNSLPEIFSDH